ncbi:MAG: hypothetical protein JNL40_11365 [Cyclobacteriaceae bacterium]|nr:hypothetical protein [Cyclobacteriaceae bacterium]
MAKRFCSFVLLVVLLAHLGGFYAYFFVRLGDLRMTMREKLSELPAEQLDVIRVPKDQFKSSLLEEREMKWQGRMYDIARVETHGDHLLVYCIHDKDEDGLLSFLSTVVDLSQQDNTRAPISVVQFLALKFVHGTVVLPHRHTAELYTGCTPYLTSYSSVLPDSVTPPPRG